MKNIFYLLGLIIFGTIVSCEREIESDAIANPVNITGQWKVNAYNDSILLYGPFKVVTLKDTSAGSDSITIQDTDMKFWEFRVKARADETSGTFGTKLSNCEVRGEEVGIKISNGKILDTDSIYFEIQFEDDETPYGVTYKIKGRRTIA
ncbi:lipid-binding protein [Proteiniphilum sp. UBA5259]|jgi:hypothetical protein|uniref:lipid-binding protein n=1 Tax=Proteiniphilum sp. UBA5259 TaxID=1947269 RepID=UPI00257D9391|nr:lipid-binding protein [Proteiniphilum sp. UBA5259]